MLWWNRYLGMKFEERGRGLEKGDCWNLVMQVYKLELDIELPSYDECYTSTRDKKALPEIIAQERQRWITPVYPKEFDVIILKMRGLPMHVGIVTKPNFMIHCAEGVDTVHVPYNSMQWKDKIVGFARYE